MKVNTKKIHQRKCGIDGRAREKGLYPVIIVQPLHDISCHSCVEERYWQFHQLDQEIGGERNIDTRADMQQYPAPQELNGGGACKQHQLTDQQQVNELHIFSGDANIHQALSKKKERSAATLFLPAGPAIIERTIAYDAGNNE